MKEIRILCLHFVSLVVSTLTTKKKVYLKKLAQTNVKRLALHVATGSEGAGTLRVAVMMPGWIKFAKDSLLHGQSVSCLFASSHVPSPPHLLAKQSIAML